jgi:hypothetical protein
MRNINKHFNLLHPQISNWKGFDRAVLRHAVGDGEGIVHLIALVDVEPAVEQDLPAVEKV